MVTVANLVGATHGIVAAQHARSQRGVPAVTTPRPRTSGNFVLGMIYAALPAGSMMINKNGNTSYLNGRVLA